MHDIENLKFLGRITIGIWVLAPMYLGGYSPDGVACAGEDCLVEWILVGQS